MTCVYCDRKAHARKMCVSHYNKWTRTINPNKDKEYEKTRRGYLMRMYRNMLSRVTGVQWRKAHLYEGKSILPKEEFYAFANNHPKFLELFAVYVATGYDQKLAPSVDRINPDKGYELSNMEFVTHSENSRRSSVTRRRND